MSFARSSVRRSSTDAVVHAIGQRVYVNRSAGPRAHVDLMSDDGTAAVAELVDGAEVMVVAWKPRGATGTRYCVRSATDGREGWVSALNLRRARTRPPVVAASPLPAAKAVVAPALGAGRNAKPRFGAR